MQKLRNAQVVLSQYGMFERELCCELLLLPNMADKGCLIYAEGCGLGSAECLC